MKNVISSKKVLIITYYYPPAGGPGVQRWLKFCKYLPDFEIEPIILKPKNPSYPIIDDSLIKEISKNQKIIEIPIWEPYSIAEKINSKNKKFKSGQFDIKKQQGFLSKLSIFIRGNFFIPDARKFWINPCYRFLKKYLTQHSINTIITTGPPHSVHLIGLKLKQVNPNLLWITDFRDPWRQISYHEELRLLNFSKVKHQQLENEVLKNADLVLTTSYHNTEQFKKIGVKNCITITNGFDSDLFIKKNTTEKFILTYSGVMEQLRNPQVLWEIISELVDKNVFNVNNFELKLIGKIDDKILEQIQKLHLSKVINSKGYLSHKQSLREIQNSDLLIITNFNRENQKGIIPGKLFDYFSTQNQILSIGPKSSDVEKLLQKTNCGLHFSYENKLGIKSFLLQSFNTWMNHSENKINIEEIMKFHIKNLTNHLVKYL